MVRVDIGEQVVHEALFLDPDAVLPGQDAARIERDPQDLGPGGMNPFEYTVDPGVEHQERMQVAVAGVEHVEHDHVVAVGDVVDLLEGVGKGATGNDGVVEVVVGGDLGDGAERGLAALPEQHALLVGLGEADVGGGIGPPEFLDAGGIDLDPPSSPSTSASSTAAASVG